jgi:uncharacterized membrane protein
MKKNETVQQSFGKVSLYTSLRILQGSGGTAPPIPTLRPRWCEWSASHLGQVITEQEVVWRHSLHWRFIEEKCLLPLPGIKPQFLGCRVTTPPMVSRLQLSFRTFTQWFIAAVTKLWAVGLTPPGLRESTEFRTLIPTPVSQTSFAASWFTAVRPIEFKRLWILYSCSAYWVQKTLNSLQLFGLLSSKDFEFFTAVRLIEFKILWIPYSCSAYWVQKTLNSLQLFGLLSSKHFEFFIAVRPVEFKRLWILYSCSAYWVQKTLNSLQLFGLLSSKHFEFFTAVRPVEFKTIWILYSCSAYWVQNTLNPLQLFGLLSSKQFEFFTALRSFEFKHFEFFTAVRPVEFKTLWILPSSGLLRSVVLRTDVSEPIGPIFNGQDTLFRKAYNWTLNMEPTFRNNLSSPFQASRYVVPKRGHNHWIWNRRFGTTYRSIFKGQDTLFRKVDT